MTSETPTNEREPLLGRESQEREAALIVDQAPDEDDDRTSEQRFAIIIPSLIIFVMFMVGALLADVPLNEISEGIICRNIFSNVTEPAHDPRCKEPEVQSELASLAGWELTFGFLPSLIVGVPYGLAADKYGRKTVLLLTIVGALLYSAAIIVICHFPDVFPLRLKWVAPIFMLVGGGVSTMNTMIYTILADVTTKAQRSTAFLYLSGTMTVCSLAASPLTYLLMTGFGPWFTVYSGFLLMCLTLPLVVGLPETRSAAVVKQAEAARNAERTANAANKGRWWDVRPMLHSGWDQIIIINQTLFVGNPRVGTLLLSTVFFAVGKSVILLMLQYVTKRFGLTWAKAGLLVAVKNVASLVFTVAILPAVSQLLLKSGMMPLFKDWWIARASALISAVGMLVMGMAPTIPLFIAALVFTECGGGLQPALRSVVTELVEKRHVALVMTALSMSLTVSEMVAGPVMAQTFKAGLYLGGMWVGMPYFVCAGLLGLGTGIIITVSSGTK